MHFGSAVRYKIPTCVTGRNTRGRLLFSLRRTPHAGDCLVVNGALERPEPIKTEAMFRRQTLCLHGLRNRYIFAKRERFVAPVEREHDCLPTCTRTPS